MLCISPAMALHGTTKAHSVQLFKQTLATHRPGGEGSRTALGSCRRPHYRCRRCHLRGGRTCPKHFRRARRCATARDQQRRRSAGRRADEATGPIHPPAPECGCPRRGYRGAFPPPRHLHGPRRNSANAFSGLNLTIDLNTGVLFGSAKFERTAVSRKHIYIRNDCVAVVSLGAKQGTPQTGSKTRELGYHGIDRSRRCAARVPPPPHTPTMGDIPGSTPLPLPNGCAGRQQRVCHGGARGVILSFFFVFVPPSFLATVPGILSVFLS